jgi:hypothetical protein
MEIDFRYLGSVKFPVYPLPSDNWHWADGLFFCDNRIVDDRNQSGATLGIRRLQTPHPILNLRKSYDYFGEMIKSGRPYFVDTGGRAFTYNKTRYTTVKYHKIKKKALKITGTVIQAYGVNFPIVVRRPPPPSKTWIGMLYLKGNPWLPYEFEQDKRPDLRRKI